MSNTDKETILSGTFKGKLYWPFLEVKDKHGKYRFDLGNLSDNAVELLKDKGIKVHNKPNDEHGRGSYVTFSSPNIPIPAVDVDGTPIKESIANGSDAVVAAVFKAYKNSFGPQIANNAQKIVVTNLIPYTPEETSIEVDLDKAV